MIRKDAIVVSLEARTLDWLREKADDRVRLKRHNFRQAGRLSDAEANYLGLLGEFAVSRHLLIPFDWQKAARQGNDGRTNLVYQGRRIDVKYTQKRAASRSSPLWLYYGTPEEKGRDAFTADVAILAIPGAGPGDVQLVGWITRERFRELSRPGTLPGTTGLRWYVDYRELEPMADLTAAPAPVQGGLFVA